MVATSNIELIASSALFDEHYYSRQIDKKGLNSRKLIEHFLSPGARGLRSPHPLFQPDYYLERYPDVATAGLNPLLHYITHGAFEGRFPNPFFDSAFYLDNFPELKSTRANPLSHYVTCELKRKPPTHELFNSQYYLSCYPEVLLTGEDPLEHYLRIGLAQKRRAYLEFDPVFYLQTYADVANAGLDPAVHFKLYGRAEGRLPRARVHGREITESINCVVASACDTAAGSLSTFATNIGVSKFKDRKISSPRSSVYWGGPVYESLNRFMEIAAGVPEVDFCIPGSFIGDNSNLPGNVTVLKNSFDQVGFSDCSIIIDPLESSALSELLLMAIKQELIVVCADDCELAALLDPSEASLIPEGLSYSKIRHALVYANANQKNAAERARCARLKIFAPK